MKWKLGMQIWDESKCASPVNGERNKPFMTHYVCAARRLQAHYRSHATPGALQTGSCIGVVFTPKRKVKGLVLLVVHGGFRGNADGLLKARVDVRLPQTSKSVSGSSLDNEWSPASFRRPFHPIGDLIMLWQTTCYRRKTSGIWLTSILVDINRGCCLTCALIKPHGVITDGFIPLRRQAHLVAFSFFLFHLDFFFG